MRKFVGKNSAGLRVRTNPSLQSEQIGIVKPEGVISFMDEVSILDDNDISEIYDFTNGI
jgi:hypothetical protein